MRGSEIRVKIIFVNHGLGVNCSYGSFYLSAKYLDLGIFNQ